MSVLRLLAGCLLTLLAAVPVCSAQEAEYLVRGGQLPVSTVANGYVQTVTPEAEHQVRVLVSTTLGPIGSVGTYAAVTAGSTVTVPAGFVLPPELAARLHGDQEAWAAATEVLWWVMQHVQLDNRQRREPQDALSVLRRRRGRCSGLANATAALLMAAGFEARTVSGLLIGDRDRVPHRWVECRLPGAGWVPTDPTLGLWVMTPRHLAFADAVIDEPEVEAAGPIELQLSDLPRRHGRLIRPNHGIELVCRFCSEHLKSDYIASSDYIVVLSGPGGQRFQSLLAPEGRFTGLLPGRWKLALERHGATVRRRYLDLKAGQTDRYTICLQPSG